VKKLLTLILISFSITVNAGLNYDPVQAAVKVLKDASVKGQVVKANNFSSCCYNPALDPSTLAIAAKQLAATGVKVPTIVLPGKVVVKQTPKTVCTRGGQPIYVMYGTKKVQTGVTKASCSTVYY
jgi:hypothetical protein